MWGTAYRRVYDALRKHYETSPHLAEVRALREKQVADLVALYDRMIDVGRAA